MPATFPYLTAPGTISTLLDKIKAAAVPQRIDREAMGTIFGMKGGAGAACIPFMKRIGFLKPDGTPSEIYKNYRNASLSGFAIFEAMKIGFAQLYTSNEKIHEAPPDALRGAIVHATGMEQDSRVVDLIVACFNALKAKADFRTAPATSAAAGAPTKIEGQQEDEQGDDQDGSNEKEKVKSNIKMGLSYTVYLNLPNTSDPAVFNAIFKALRENLVEK
jgi:hypothetical protein